MVNRWQIMEFMIVRYMTSGMIPTGEEIMNELGPIPVKELQEGIYEFDVWHSGIWMKRQKQLVG